VRNAELEKLDALVGEWNRDDINAWFLGPGPEVPGTSTLVRPSGPLA
jgi:hypothetical protein